MAIAFPLVLRRDHPILPRRYLMGGIAGQWFWTPDLELAMRYKSPKAAGEIGRVCGHDVAVRFYKAEIHLTASGA